jgi:hypothetical protein
VSAPHKRERHGQQGHFAEQQSEDLLVDGVGAEEQVALVAPVGDGLPHGEWWRQADPRSPAGGRNLEEEKVLAAWAGVERQAHAAGEEASSTTAADIGLLERGEQRGVRSIWGRRIELLPTPLSLSRPAEEKMRHVDLAASPPTHRSGGTGSSSPGVGACVRRLAQLRSQ